MVFVQSRSIAICGIGSVSISSKLFYLTSFRTSIVSKSHKDPTMSTTPDSKPKRHWSAADKAKLVRRHIRDGIPVATLADENDTAPSMIHAWIRTVLESADQVLSDKRERDGHRAEKQLAAKDDHIRHLEEVVADIAALQLPSERFDLNSSRCSCSNEDRVNGDLDIYDTLALIGCGITAAD